MAGGLIKLKAIIYTYAGTPDDKITSVVAEEIKGFAYTAVNSLQVEIEENIICNTHDTARKQSVADIQLQLTSLANHISLIGKEENQAAQITQIFNWVLTRLFSLLDHLHKYFPTVFDFEAVLPSQFLSQYHPTHLVQEKEILNKLGQTGVDPQLFDVTQSYFLAFNEPDQVRISTWRHWDYLLHLLDWVNEFTLNPAEGDSTLALLKLFIAKNFNSIHIYAFFLKYMEHLMQSDRSFQEQQQDLLHLLKVFRQVRVENQYSYDSRVQLLQTSLIDCLTAELEYLTQKEKLFLKEFKSTDNKTSKFYFDVMVTLAELMFFFRVLMEVGFIRTKFNSYLYEFVAAHIHTQRSENLSKKSMRNHFSNQPFPDRLVQNVREWLSKMIKHIDIYYKG